MTEELSEPMTSQQRARILEQLDQMLQRGQMTAAEATRLRAATDPAEFEGAIRDVRARHAGARIDAAVKKGSMTQQEADDILLSIKKGEHSPSLRSHLNQLAHRKRSAK